MYQYMSSDEGIEKENIDANTRLKGNDLEWGKNKWFFSENFIYMLILL